MTDEKKRSEEDVVSDEQLEDVAGGFTLHFGENNQAVMDTVAGQTGKVQGTADALRNANNLLSNLSPPDLTAEGDPTKRTKGS